MRACARVCARVCDTFWYIWAGVCRVQKRASVPMKRTVSGSCELHHVGAGKHVQAVWKSNKQFILNQRIISPALSPRLYREGARGRVRETWPNCLLVDHDLSSGHMVLLVLKKLFLLEGMFSILCQGSAHSSGVTFT